MGKQTVYFWSLLQENLGISGRKEFNRCMQTVIKEISLKQEDAAYSF